MPSILYVVTVKCPQENGYLAVTNYIELKKVLEAQDYDSVLGTEESNWIDFKEKAYQTQPSESDMSLTTGAKFELAKDVAALANDQGGSIVLGFKETKDPTRGVSTASSAPLIRSAAFDASHYKDVIQNNIYPSPRNVTIKWYGSQNPSRGVLVIHVPKSRDSNHIVRHLTDESGNKVEGMGIPTRNDDRIQWMSAEELHGKISGTGSLKRPDSSEASSASQDNARANAKSAIESLIQTQDWADLPTITLQVVPLRGPDQLSDFYDQVQQAIQRPEPIRQMGFGLGSLGGRPTVVEGAFVLSGVRDSIARLEPNGLFTITLHITPNFVGWAVNRDRDSSSSVLINATVLIEFTLELCRFAHKTLASHGLQQWSYHVECRNLKKSSVMLHEGAPGRWFNEDEVLASSDSWAKTIDNPNDAESDAFRILTSIYALWGLPESGIPYTKDKRVSIAALKELNKNPF